MNADERAIDRFAHRLETLAGRARVKKLFAGDGIEHYLDLQNDLFQLQIDLQRAIGESKLRERTAEARSYLENLRNHRWLARRLGDAIAWTVLLHNRQLIEALNKNTPIPVPSSWSDGLRGTFEFARIATSRELGIPIVHDITNVLRIGDITFMLPKKTGGARDAEYRTVELKTTRLTENVTEGGQTKADFRVTVISTEPLPFANAPSASEHIPNDYQRRRTDRRIDRQLERMSKATAMKNAPVHEHTKIGDELFFSVQLPEEEQPHWVELRRAIRTARQDGFAYLELGGFVGYSLIYNANGVTKEDIDASPILNHVAGLMHDEIGSRNSITLSAVPDEEDDTFSSFVLPLFLWEVPQRAVRDVLRNRLLITATYNSGWMEKLLSDAGLTVIPAKTGSDQRSFEVVAHFSWDGQARVEYHSSVWREMFVAVHEFRGPKAVIQRALAVTLAPTLVTLDKFFPSELDDESTGELPDDLDQA